MRIGLELIPSNVADMVTVTSRLSLKPTVSRVSVSLATSFDFKCVRSRYGVMQRQLVDGVVSVTSSL
jgi:hypothetical protein